MKANQINLIAVSLAIMWFGICQIISSFVIEGTKIYFGLFLIIISIHIFWSRSKENAKPFTNHDVRRGAIYTGLFTILLFISTPVPLWTRFDKVGIILLAGGGVTAIFTAAFFITRKADN